MRNEDSMSKKTETGGKRKICSSSDQRKRQKQSPESEVFPVNKALSISRIRALPDKVKKRIFIHALALRDNNTPLQNLQSLMFLYPHLSDLLLGDFFSRTLRHFFPPKFILRSKKAIQAVFLSCKERYIPEWH